MTPLNVRDVVSPQMFRFFQIFGYTLFALGWVFIAFAVPAAVRDVRSALARWREDGQQRPFTPKVAMQPAESPIRARRDPARVLAFVAVKRTRNRVVVR